MDETVAIHRRLLGVRWLVRAGECVQMECIRLNRVGGVATRRRIACQLAPPCPLRERLGDLFLGLRQRGGLRQEERSIH